MTALLQWIIQDLVCWIRTGATDVVNAAVVAVAAFAQALFVLLPAMPAFPSMPAGLDWFYWLIPVPAIVGALGTGAVLYATVTVLMIALRWVRAL